MILEKMLENLPGKPHFKFFSFLDVNPVSGREKQRTVAAPNDAMKVLQRRFLLCLRGAKNENLRTRMLRYATSSNPGDSPLRNILQHRDNRFFYLVDFSNAYGSVVVERLAPVVIQFHPFRSVSTEEMADFLERYFFGKGHGLVQGGPASQDLFNLYAGSVVDMPLANVVRRGGVVYTRYIDDLTFSSAQKPLSEDIRRHIRNPILQAGFLINHRKCECVDLKKRTVVITGIGLADGGRVFIPRPYVLKMRGLMHHALTKGEVAPGRIQGMVALMKQVLGDQKPNGLERRVLKEYEQFLRHV